MNFDLQNSLAILQRTPDVLRALLGGLPSDWTNPNEGPDTWSPFNIVGHLIDGEETNWFVRVRAILDPDSDHRFPPFDRFRHLRIAEGQPLQQLLDRFADLRERNLVALRSLELTRDDLRATGEHPAFGAVALEQLLATWVVHDLGHIGQIARVMTKQYREAVGPWAEYLPILQR